MEPPLSDTTERRCSKPGCASCGSLQRHHKGHEAMWLSAFAWRRGDARYTALRTRYYAFSEEDIVLLGAAHHAEVHAHYDELIADDMARLGLPLYLYSWQEAAALSRRLARFCEQWLRHASPGISPTAYEDTKALRRSLLRRRARRDHPPTIAKRKRRDRRAYESRMQRKAAKKARRRRSTKRSPRKRS